VRRAAIAEKAVEKATAISKVLGRKKVLKIINNLISPAPTLNFKRIGAANREMTALVG
jgi:hypothetical protein